MRAIDIIYSLHEIAKQVATTKAPRELIITEEVALLQAVEEFYPKALEEELDEAELKFLLKDSFHDEAALIWLLHGSDRLSIHDMYNMIHTLHTQEDRTYYHSPKTEHSYPCS